MLLRVFLSLCVALAVSHPRVTFATSQSSCQKLSNNGATCQCDDQCEYFNDCCIARKKRGDRKSVTFTCQKYFIYSDKKNVVNRINIYEIDKCPDDPSVSDELKNKCESPHANFNLPQQLPWLNRKTGRLYRNVFCAMCNRESEKTELIGASSIVHRIQCAHPLMYKSIAKHILNGDCQIFYNLPAVSKRRCYRRMISDCKHANKTREMAGKCSSEPQQIHKWNSRFYRNKACCECNKVDPDKQCRLIARVPTASMAVSNSITDSFNFRKWCTSEDWCQNSEEWLSNVWESTDSKQNLKSNETICQSEEQTGLPPAKILQYVAIIISLISLVLLLIVFQCTKKTPTFGDRLTKALAASLISFYFLIIINDQLNSLICRERLIGLCVTIAVARHFNILLIFAWMSLYAFDMIFTILQKKAAARPPAMQRKRLVKFVGFSIGFPLVFVGLAGVIQLADAENVISPGYGLPNCFFTNWRGATVWYLMPLSGLLLFNLCVSGAIFHYFIKTAFTTQFVKSEDDNQTKKMMVLCVQLTSVFGLIWILQLLSFIVKSKLLQESLMIVNLLQGLFMTICFIQRRQFKKAYTKSTSLRKKSTQSTSSSNSKFIKTAEYNERSETVKLSSTDYQ